MENQLLQTAQGVEINSDVTTGALPEGAIARLGRGCVHDMALSPAGEYLAIGSRIGLWWYKLPSLYPIALWETERGLVSAVAFSPCGNRLVTGHWDGEIKVWNVQQAELLVKLKIPSITDKKVPVKQVAFSPDGRCLAVSGSEDVVYVWRLETGDLIAKFSGEVEKRSCPWSSIIPLSFSPDGCLLASTNFDNTVSIWNVEKMKELPALPDIRAGCILSAFHRVVSFSHQVTERTRYGCGMSSGVYRRWCPLNMRRIGRCHSIRRPARCSPREVMRTRW